MRRTCRPMPSPGRLALGLSLAFTALAAPLPALAQGLPPGVMGQMLQSADPATLAAIANAMGNTGGSGTSLPAMPLAVPTASPNPAQPVPVDGAAPSVAPGNTAASGQYVANAISPVFGAQLFTGAFARAGAAHFNPDYVITPGDQVVLRLWGAFQYAQVQTVDPQGNVFLPNIGPIHLAGVRNQDLQRVITGAAAGTFRSNVYVYASLAEAQPVRVFVGGFVRRPGLYDGTSMDGLLHYLDAAGGIDPDRGTFIDVEVKRGEQVRAHVNLYQFLFRGVMPPLPLADGDVIFVGPRQQTVTVLGLANNANVFEFPRNAHPTTADVALLAGPQPVATHMRITRATGPIRNVDYRPLGEAGALPVGNGDTIEFTSDQKNGTITVRIEGEHESRQEYVLPYGAHLGDLLRQIRFSERSDATSIQLFRQSVKDRQKTMLDASLHSLEQAALTARSGTNDESQLRHNEADLILQWIDRARKVQPLGQVVIGQGPARDDLLLENGDLLRVPTRDGLVLVSGEVLFPNAVAWQAGLDATSYVERAGGFTQKSAARRIVVAHADGSFEEVAAQSRAVRSGDDLLVLPRIDTKSRQILKDMTQILYQIAVSAKVVLGL
ncbi:polysaccharide biosynthesis/export family protein [Novosphingobium sp. B-7]|uniref:polysaccharide biosynthesis/export family protein n=1 Tax=Novosphingobium sp. B-7 TaxID=1298855 RepID=UPI0003B4A963|nr:polysaccharide biosynthesis/export family protein [Novosphingobium sp. B-7]